ncbi:Sec63 complex subunit SEC62 [Lachancea thermotolerans CBS 6340]|uniref:Translocation protein SEC62 n=1 Tax=Lachancea thermotolerans (strain ATCC 56472 / CBS 6340 / NRRL Y-8284) TaxID=559295 RepID=C5DIK6_LACTC|nr:KLTH0E13266p [Lachancea thermotolerans CBS 6340]CAR23617.1 KLTH0E13266p [Lachancea thermotolerans CBS 6340]
MSNPASTVAIGSLLRRHKLLKQRQGLFQSRHVDFFRYKRFVRALNAREYQSKSANQPDLYPVVDNEEDARKVFIELIKAQLVVPCRKLHSAECKDHGLKPDKDYPNLLLSDKATLQPDEYYAWNFNPKTLTDYLLVLGIVAGILAFVCYPLWPSSMRRVVYYISLALLALIGLFFAVAILRFIIYLLSLAVCSEKGGFWLFPNLFEDCGVLESFKPLYGSGESECYSYIKKMKRRKRKMNKKD